MCDIMVFISDCGTITPPANGAVDHASEGTVYESKAYFSCNPGYILTGVASVTCQADQSWDGTTPTCVIRGEFYQQLLRTLSESLHKM